MQHASSSPLWHFKRSLTQLTNPAKCRSIHCFRHAAPLSNINRTCAHTANWRHTAAFPRLAVGPAGCRYQSMLSGFMNNMKDRMNKYQGRELVGEDEMGNRYYEMKELDPSQNEALTRREVEYHSKHMEEFEIMDIPTQWRSWLKHFRSDPPSNEEIRRYEMQRKLILSKAAEIDAAEAKWKLEQQKLNQKVMAAAENLTSNSALPIKPLQSPQERQGTRADTRQGQDDDVFLGESSGQGESFEPGTWDPSVNKGS